jgi:23S rRNA (guanosine2251-2'-O)-methyltransferase
MADSRKPSRPSTPRKSGPARKPRPGQGKREDNEWSSSGPKRSGGPKPAGTGYAPSKPSSKGPGKGPGKPAGKSGGKFGGKPGEKGSAPREDRRDDRRPARPDDRRPVRQDNRPERPAKDAARKANDDFDIDIDLSFERDPNEAPAAFPKPARPPKSPAGAKPAERDSRPPRPRYEKSDKPYQADKSGRPERSARPERPGRPERPAFAKAAPRSADAEPEDGKSITAGRNPVRELLEAAPKRIDTVLVRKGQRDAKVQEIVTLADDNRIKVQFVDDLTLRRLYAGSHQGVVAITAAVEYAELDVLINSVKDAPLPVLLALDQVQDPGNLGAMARTAWALGAAGIIVPRHGGAYIGAGAMRSSAGALHHLPVARVTNLSQTLDACADAGLSILCADAEGENLYTATIHLPAVLVLGGEGKGVRFGVGKHCQQRLAVPLRRTFDSLNVAQAAAICLARLGQL